MLEHLKPFNIILAIDGYKSNHWKEIPANVDYAYANIVPRKASSYSNEIVAMGQSMLASLFASVRITEDMIDEAELEITEQGYDFNRAGWEDILRNNHGILPLQIYGVEEGRVVKPQTPIVGIENTKPGFAWLVTYVEPFAQSLVWKMSTVASICRTVRVKLTELCIETGTDTAAVDYMLHNFGDRGADSPHEAAVLAGIAHAAVFNGSDCVRANGYIKKLYNTSKAYTSSIEATEHSVMCANSDMANRDDWGAAVMAVDRLYERVASAANGVGLPMMSVVIDTYDSRRFVKEYMGKKLRTRIEQSGGKMIMRPDSGDPTVEPGMVGHDLKDTFGYTVNSKGKYVLPPHTGVIQGDGIRVETFEGVVRGWINAGFSLDGFALGMGSGVTHDGARDDFSFSFKATANCIGGYWVRLLKEPITDRTKKSLSGLVYCMEDRNGELRIYDAMDTEQVYNSMDQLFKTGPGWRSWYKDGFREYRQSFDEVRARARV